MESKVRDRSTKTAAVSTKLDSSGNFSAAFDPTSSAVQTMRITSGSIAGSAIALPPGALSIPVDITLGEGPSLTSSSTLSALGLSDNQATAAGPSVSVIASSAVECTSPFTLSLPLSFGTSLKLALALESEENLVVIYRWTSVSNGVSSHSTGVLTKDDLIIGSDYVQFQTTKFGTFQLAVTETKIVEKINVPIELPPVLKSQVPPLTSVGYDVSEATFLRDTTKVSLIPKLVGGEAYNFSISPELPKGLDFDVKTGKISGVAIANSEAADYIVTALNDVSSVEAKIKIQVVDPTPPTVVISSTATNPTSASTFIVTVTFSESVSGFDLSDLVLVNCTVSGLSGSGQAYSFMVSPTASGAVSIQIPTQAVVNTFGIANTASTVLSTVFDNTAVTVALSTAASSFVTGAFGVTVTLSSIPFGFDITDVTVTNATATNLSGSGTSYTFDVNPTSEGVVTVAIAAGSLADSLGNFNSASNTLSITKDSIAPSTFSNTSPSSNAHVTTTPPLIWNASSDANAFTYSVMMSTSSPCTTANVSLSGASGLTASSYNGAALSEGVYYWCVIATDAAGNQTTSGEFILHAHTPAFSCDAGKFETTCTVSSSKSISNGTTVYIYGDLLIENSGVITVSGSPYNSVLNVNGALTLTGAGRIQGNFAISAASLNLDAPSLITANGLGGLGGSSGQNGLPSGSGGLYSSSGGGGGAHGGFGGANIDGASHQPGVHGVIDLSSVSYGSGGGGGSTADGGAGGGAINIFVSGLTTNLGTIEANGVSGVAGASSGGGGAGGSIKIVTSSIAGTGNIRANGGLGGCSGSNCGGGGGGGRIRLESANKFAGSIEASGGYASGKPKTVAGDGTYSQNISNGYCDSGSIDNGQICTISTRTWMGTDEIFQVNGSLTLSGGNESLVIATRNQTGSRTSSPNGFMVNVGQTLTVSTGHIWEPAVYSMKALDVLKEINAETIVVNGTMKGNFPLIFAKNISIASTGEITASGLGHPGGEYDSRGGGDATSATVGSGGGHCGAGGNGISDSVAVGATYINSYGSGGYGATGLTGGSGGGKIKIIARGNLTFASGGKISANGFHSLSSGNQVGGGGAGGSIFLDVGNLTGSSDVQVYGGNSSQNTSSVYNGGGGGGGCIRVFRKYAAGASFGITGGNGSNAGASGTATDYDLEGTGQFRKIFVTSAAYALNVGVTPLNTACTTEASNAGLYAGVSGVTWVALVSSTGNDASSKLTTNKVSNVKGQPVRNGGNLLFSALLNPVTYHADGSVASNANDVITASTSAGTFDSAGSCNNFTTNSGSYSYSNPGSSVSNWFNMGSSAGNGCAGSARVYCISQ